MYRAVKQLGTLPLIDSPSRLLKVWILLILILCVALIALNRSSVSILDLSPIPETEERRDANNCSRRGLANATQKYRKKSSGPYLSPPLKPHDYNRLIDLSDFDFSILNNESCRDAFLLVVVTSAPANRERRHAIRVTWAQKDPKVTTFFLLAKTKDEQTQRSIDEENRKYRDIVQGNFADSYRNLTYKTVMGLKFISYHCHEAKYVLKTDDDVFVNMPLMKNYLVNDLSERGVENYLACHRMNDRPPIRNRKSKWYLSETDFPGERFPTYCNGAYSLMSMDVVLKFYAAAQKIDYLYLEDVFLYGIVRAGFYPNIEVNDVKRFSLYPKMPARKVLDRTPFLFGMLGMTAKQLVQMWRYVISRPVFCSVYDTRNNK